MLLCGERQRLKQTVFKRDRDQKVSRGAFKGQPRFSGLTTEGETELEMIISDQMSPDLLWTLVCDDLLLHQQGLAEKP